MTATLRYRRPIRRFRFTGDPPRRMHLAGPMQRWLISPEIGALHRRGHRVDLLLGEWRTFGQANSTLNWLDVAAPTGIMATAVALLMIGGEFDLSSGVMTGASAIDDRLDVAHLHGRPASTVGWAIGLASPAAAIGWFNGFMVNKTGLPSFIVTLASFFGVRGMIVVLSQRLSARCRSTRSPNNAAAASSAGSSPSGSSKSSRARDTLFLTLVIVGGVAFSTGCSSNRFTRLVARDPRRGSSPWWGSSRGRLRRSSQHRRRRQQLPLRDRGGLGLIAFIVGLWP